MAARVDSTELEGRDSGIVAVGKLFLEQFQKHDVPGLGAELAYRFLFAVFPFGLFVAALAAFVADAMGLDNPTDDILAALGDNLPSDIAAAIRPELARVVETTQPGLLSFGAIASLWAATGGVNALMKGMNRAYGVDETRPFPVRIFVAVALTVLGALGLIASFVTVVGGAFLTQQVAEQLGVAAQTWTLIQWLRWPLVFVVLVVAVAIVYRFAPNVRVPWRWIFLGATVFTLGWIAATAAFGFYVSRFADYGATYGAFASVIVLMLWFYLTAVLLVGSAELVAVATKTVDSRAIDERQAEIRIGNLAGDAVRSAWRAVDESKNWGPATMPVERALVPVEPPRVTRESVGFRRSNGVSPVAVAAAVVGLTLAGEIIRSKIRPSR